jgi:hypothetical protein
MKEFRQWGAAMTLVPEQIVVPDVAILTDGVAGEVTVMVIALDVAVADLDMPPMMS